MLQKAVKGLGRFALLLGAAAWGQDVPPPPAPSGDAAKAVEEIRSGSTPAAATVEKIMEQAVRNIARRYNLNETQTQETDKLMTREVHKFLQEHEAEVWPVIRDLLAVQLGGKPPESREEMQRIGKSARPLLALAKESIFRANEEWRTYLNADQRRVHDYDLMDMERQFQVIEQNFSDWSEGRAAVDQGLFPPPAPDHGPPRPVKPAPGLPEPEVEIFRDSLFDTFVEAFIKDYGLDQGQADSARSILKEFKAKAKDFRKSNQDEEKNLVAELLAAKESRVYEKIREAEKKRKKFLEPINALFLQLEDRLKGLLTSAQLERYALRRPTIPGDVGTLPTDRMPQTRQPVRAPLEPAPEASPPKTDGQ